MIFSRDIQRVHAQIRPIEARSKFHQGCDVNPFVDQNSAKEAVLCERVEQEIHDLADRRVCAAQIETRRLLKCIAPWWRDERDRQLIHWRGDLHHAGAVVRVQDLDGEREPLAPAKWRINQ